MTTATISAPKKTYKIRIISGEHEQKDETGEYRKYRPRRYFAKKVAGEMIPADPPEWNGDVFLSDRNYATKWPEKFELANEPRLAQETDRREGETLQEFAARITALAQQEAQSATVSTPTQPADELESQFILPVKTKEDLLTRLQSMTVKGLQDLAADEEVDLGGATTKEQIVQILSNIRY